MLAYKKLVHVLNDEGGVVCQGWTVALISTLTNEQAYTAAIVETDSTDGEGTVLVTIPLGRCLFPQGEGI